MKWSEMEIGQLCLSTFQRDPGQTPEESFVYVDIASIDRNLKTIVQPQYLIGAEAPSRARKIIHTNDVLVSTVRPNLNTVVLVPEEFDGQIASTGFCILRPNPDLLNSRYLFYRTIQSDFIDYLVARMRGANYPAVTDKVVKEAPIPLPPLSEQQRIVEILDQADALRRKRAEADAWAERILPALFIKMFGDPGTNSRRWELSTLVEAGADIRYGLGQPPKPSPDGLPLIRATNIDHGTITEKDLIFVEEESVPKNRNAFLSADEVIVVRSGAYTGDVAQVTDKWAGSVIGYDLVIKPGPVLCGEFIEAYLLTPHIQNNYFGNLKARAGQPHLNASQLSATPILLPPKELQSRFAENVRIIREIRDQAIKTKETVNDLFNLLLHLAFSGELTAKWREAHLKELRAEMDLQAQLLADEPVQLTLDEAFSPC